jgi:[acyl-carrier-protein] S-malonyltransferase
MADAATRVALVFPGAGVESCGAEAELCARNRAAFAPYLGEASERARLDLAAALAGGRVDAIPDREKQYFTYAFGAGYAALLLSRGVEPVATAGYSFGVYAALFGAGAATFTQGLDILERAYAVMAEEIGAAEHGMAIAVGLGEAEVRAVLRGEACAELVLATSNSETCHVVSGPRAALEAAVEGFLARDAVAARLLPVAIPYHHPRLLGRASARLRDFLAGVGISPARRPVVSSVDQRALIEPREIAAFVAANLSTPISWVRVLETLASRGARAVIECGPGVSLSQNARFVDGAPTHISLKNARGRLGL